jgi:type IV secretory pathway TraG/TraD family ATPase VirD4
MPQQNSQTPLPPLPKLPSLDPNLLGISGLIGLLFLLKIFDKLLKRRGRGKPKLGRARMAKKSEWETSQEQTRKDIINQHKTNNFSQFGGWVGRPETIIHRDNQLEMSDSQLFLNRLNEHLLLLASSGSGKSFSVFDPLVRSLIEQGFSLGIFDFKGDEEGDSTCCPSSKLAGYALELGYKVRVIAPGYADSDRINLIQDFVKDAATAYELATVLWENINKGKDSRSDDFFPLAGKILIQAIFLVCKFQPEEGVCDLALAHKLLALPDLIERIKCKDLPQFIKVIFDQFLSTAGSPETAASIAATAQGLFARFQIPEAWAVFCGESTVPVLLGEKELVIYRMNPLLESALSPLMASVMYLQMQANAFGKRPTKKPFVMVMDEFPRVLIPSLGKFMAIVRSKMMAFLLAAQGIASIEETYGKLATEAIMTNAKTVFVGQLSCDRTIQHYSKSYGKEDIGYETSSTSQQNATFLGGSSSDNNNLSTRDLVPVEELAEAPQGTFYLRSPIIKGVIDGKKRERLLTRVVLKIPEHELTAASKAEATWFKYRNQRIQNPIAVSLSERQLVAREKYAEKFLPMPPSAARQAFSKLVK